uniref:Uncharacterized protein n=1 Tax=viral metagenome TaxID=1070528 RepID=A0A6C0C002_9ZZZZ
MENKIDKRAATDRLTMQIREQLQLIASRMYAQQIPLPWVAMYICQEAIEQVICGARRVLNELGYGDDSLLHMSADELTPLWTQHLQASLDASRRAAPHVLELQYATIQDVAGSAHAALKQKVRNRYFMSNGAAPGLATFPMLSSEEKSKSLPMPFILTGNPRVTQQKEYVKYMSHIQARRRLPSARSYAGCILAPDTTRPELYT